MKFKIPKGQGLWPAIWMMPEKNRFGGWPKSGEIDLMEARGSNTNEVLSTLHFFQNGHRLLGSEYKVSNENNFNFPYLHDETQEIAKAYDAVCTPDFFGYNKNLKLQYRGRLRELKNFVPVKDGESDLLMAMKQVAKTQKGPEDQIPSAGCGIKWKYD